MSSSFPLVDNLGKGPEQRTKTIKHHKTDIANSITKDARKRRTFFKKDYEGIEKSPKVLRRSIIIAMTCIAGITNGATVFVGGDRGASDGSSMVSMAQPKVYTRDEWIYGYAGTIGIGQLMNYIPLPPPDGDIQRLIRLDIVEQLRNSIESFGRETDNHDTSWLIGAQGRLFELSAADWGVVEVYETAIGSGNEIALGSLYTSSLYIHDNKERMEIALRSAITYSPTCQGPLDILQLDLS